MGMGSYWLAETVAMAAAANKFQINRRRSAEAVHLVQIKLLFPNMVFPNPGNGFGFDSGVVGAGTPV